MEEIQQYSAQILLLLFLIIVFLQSGIDKIFDWKGNVSWLKEHFAQTPLHNLVPFLLFTLLVIETIAGILCAVGLLEIVVYQKTTIAFYGSLLSCISLLMLLFGQRMAKDYEGAKNIAVYFIPAIFLLYLLQA
ncbi:DoxX family membrane protein [Euzebyella marina]|uniref:DoxX family membrane protein n=1 Tax=Euzebyella marina TaxID=1761453 RepID=A0A3G2L1E4_9FLAO|nr:DoxX family membrane protein [Euzebyella marina]AYN66072.1 DoxX family membrane protein [Euzebyella marina]